MSHAPRLALLLTAAAVAAAAPAAASAAPRWGSPVALPGVPSAAEGAAPEAFITPSGATLVLTGAGGRVTLSGGTAAGTFAPALDLGATSGTPDGALGADGTVAVAWPDGGTIRVVIRRPDGTSSAHELPAGGATAASVAVAPDGSVLAAWRTRATKQYGISTALAAPGGGFGEPQVLESGTTAVDGVRADAGPDGTWAVVSRRITSGYRARVAVRPAGAPAFSPSQTLSAGPGNDLDVGAAFAADGTLVVAWDGPAGAQSAARPAGGAFGEPAPIGPAGEPGFGLDVEPTPQGGIAVAWDAGGPVRRAVRPLGAAGFEAAAQVLTREGDLPFTPQVGVAADATTIVVAVDTARNEVRAVTGAAPPELVGYADAAVANADLATGAGAQALAVWGTTSAGVRAVTRSESVPPSTGPGPRPVAADRTAPTLRARPAKGATTLRTRQRTLKLALTSSEAGTVEVRGDTRATIGGRRTVQPFATTKPATLRRGTSTFSLRLTTPVQRLFAKALKARRGVRVSLVITAKDRAGNMAERKLVLYVRPAKRR